MASTRPIISANGVRLPPHGPADAAVFAGGTLVTLTAELASGWSVLRVVLQERPDGSAAALSSTTSLPATVTLDKGGTYRVRVVAQGPEGQQSVTTALAVVRTPVRALELLDETDDSMSPATRRKLNALTIDYDGVAWGAVTAERLADGAVTTTKLADSAVTAAKIDDEAATTAKIADGAVTWAKIAAAVVDDLSQRAIDSSLVLSNMGAWDFQRTFSYADICRARPRAYIDATHELAYVNESAATASAGSAVRAMEVVVLPGATEMTLTVAHKQGSTSGAFVLGLWPGITNHPLSFASLAAPLASATPTPTSSVGEASATATGLTPGDVLFAGVAMNAPSLGGGANQRHYIGHVRVTSNSNDAFWGSSLQRIHVDDDVIVDNAWDPTPAPFIAPYMRGRSFSPGSRVRLLTNATEIGLEMFSPLDPIAVGESYQRNTSLQVWVDGRYFGRVAPTVGKREVNKITGLPAGLKIVEIVHGYCVGGAASTWLQAVYVAAGRVATVLPAQPARRRMVWVGDSISAGMLVTGEPCSHPVHLIRDRYPGTVLMDAWGNRRLSQDIAIGGVYNEARMKSLAANIARHRPDDVGIAVETNDYAFAEWNAADYGVGKAALVDYLHTLIPAARIYLLSAFTRGSEVANAKGDTTGAYRTQTQTIATARSDYCTYVNGAGPGNNAVDGVHMNDAGTYVAFNYVLDIVGYAAGF